MTEDLKIQVKEKILALTPLSALEQGQLLVKYNGRFDLRGYDFSSSGDLSAYDFSGCDLEGAVFRECRLIRSKFIASNLRRTSFAGAQIGRAHV